VLLDSSLALDVTHEKRWPPRRRVCAQSRGLGEVDEFVYEGATCAVGGHGHRSLMLEACRAKFNQNAEARQALLATGNRPLMHRVRRDSKTIPGVAMAEIWMRIRDGLNRSQVE
jgi:hypothetical protein